MKPRNDLAACLVAAQAEAERLYGAGPVARWRPARRSRWMVVAIVAAVTAGGLWIGPPDAPPTREAPAAVVAAGPVEAAAPAPAGAIDLVPPTSQPTVVFAQAAIAPPEPAPPSGAPSPMWRPADPDAWALDPRPIGLPMAATTKSAARLLLLHNPTVPADAAESATADESQPDAEPGGGHEE